MIAPKRKLPSLDTLLTMREQGISYPKIARRYGVSHQRVWQVVNPERVKPRKRDRRKNK